MPVVACPHCGATACVDDRDLGQLAECPACRGEFVPREEADRPRPRSRYDDRRPYPPSGGNDGSGLAVASAVLGVCSVLCCVAGAVLGLGGLVTGVGGLQSRRRGWSVFGLATSLTGLLVSVAFFVFVFATQVSQRQAGDARPDGTRTPFADQFKTP